ncbi:MAG: hypothetical protein U5K74_04350 [Gemmatimonadaceae bacterium]|nr:hypothetical protein [Gemmatimonadaceae bacterium]
MRTGNDDIWIARIMPGATAQSAPRARDAQAATRDATIDDAVSLTTTRDGSLWLAWTAMRARFRGGGRRGSDHRELHSSGAPATRWPALAAKFKAMPLAEPCNAVATGRTHCGRPGVALATDAELSSGGARCP